MKPILTILKSIFSMVFLIYFVLGSSILVALDGQEKIIYISSESGVRRFDIEIAESSEQKRKGLMNRVSLNPESGMLFLYESPRRVSFWMKDTLITLDVIFITADGEIKKIYHSARPLSLDIMTAGDNIAAVLEIKGNTAKALELRIGDCVRHFFFLKNGLGKSCNFKD